MTMPAALPALPASPAPERARDAIERTSTLANRLRTIGEVAVLVFLLGVGAERLMASRASAAELRAMQLELVAIRAELNQLSPLVRGLAQRQGVTINVPPNSTPARARAADLVQTEPLSLEQGGPTSMR